MNLEREILKKVSLNNSFIHDDCAYLNNSQQLISTDTLVENVHFNLKIFSASQIAHRLFICSFSDIQSSGGYPQYALLNISFPNKNFAFIKKIIHFFQLLLRKYNIQLIGGDTTSSNNIYLSSTFISRPLVKNKVLNRKNAKIGDYIYTFKNIGFSKLGYLNLFKKTKLIKSLQNKSQKQFLSPKIQNYSLLFNQFEINSCMDISDSLYLSLKELSKQSQKKFLIKNLKLINPILFETLKLNEYHSLILSSGEEFMPIFTGKLSKSNIEKLRSKKINVVNIGIVQKGKGISFEDLKNIKDNSFDHFKNNYSKL